MGNSFIMNELKMTCTCEKCGKEADVDTSIVLTSYPPQYNYHCPYCGNRGYVFCSDCHRSIELETLLDDLVNPPKPNKALKDLMSPMYQMIADENELKWFFDHVIVKPQVSESYSAVFVSRHKKLTKEEQETIGLTRKESEFLATQTFRLAKFRDALTIDADTNWTFDNFLKRIKRFNVDKYAYTTSLGEPIPTKTLAVIFYVNPCDDIKVCREFVTQYLDVNQSISKAMLNGKTSVDNLQSYQWYGNAESNIKHLKANCKGTKYWVDYDLDVPSWWKDDSTIYESMIAHIEKFYKKGDYIIISTSGGYHILVKSSAIKFNPNDLCREMAEHYSYYVTVCGKPRYVDDNGNEKFECIVNDSQIPGIPLPGTFQYNRPVTVLNKEDFE